MVKYFYEGARTATIFLILSFLSLYLISLLDTGSIIFWLPKIIFLLLPFLGQFLFPFYKIPENTGDFKVGYKEFRLNDKC
jgi:hypothetical protein